MCVDSYANSNAIGAKLCIDSYAKIALEEDYMMRRQHNMLY